MQKQKHPIAGGDEIQTRVHDAAHHRTGKVCTIASVHSAGRFDPLRIEDDRTIQQKPARYENDCVNGALIV